MPSNEIKDGLLRVCAELNSNGVEYLVIGGAAVNHCGFSRPSGIGGQHAHLKVDLDFWYNPTENYFERLINALEDLEIDTEDLQTIVFDKKRTFIKIPYEHFHTDFLPVIEGIDPFRTCLNRADILTIKEISIPILSLDDLIKNKQFL
ncbi:MAG: hypothetical protein ACKO3B_10480, partial [Bacteroidota bacterium]